MKQHTLVLNKILLSTCMYYSFIPSWSNSADSSWSAPCGGSLCW